MARTLWLSGLCALPLFLASCQTVDPGENTETSEMGSTINAMQLVDGTTLEYSSSSVLVKGCGIEFHELYNAQGTPQGIARIANSQNYLSIEMNPAPPWLAVEGEAKYWTSVPSEGTPAIFSTSKTESGGVPTLTLWLPLAEELIGMSNASLYVSGIVQSQLEESSSTQYLMDEAPGLGDASYVNFHTCIYPPLADPDPALFSSSSSLDESSASVAPSSSSQETSSSSQAVSSSSLKPSSSSIAPLSSSIATCSSSSSGFTGGDGYSSMVAPSSSSYAGQSSSTHIDWNLCGKEADGRTIGFWKNNLGKYIDGARKGIQVSAAEMKAYLDELGLSAPEALALLSSHSSDPRSLLAKQLTGSRFNLARGAYIDGDEDYTRDFIGWGLDLLEQGDATAQELLDAKDLFDAYNNSHGGAIGMRCSL